MAEIRVPGAAKLKDGDKKVLSVNKPRFCSFTLLDD
jgi:hypothetical protein